MPYIKSNKLIMNVKRASLNSIHKPLMLNDGFSRQYTYLSFLVWDLVSRT